MLSNRKKFGLGLMALSLLGIVGATASVKAAEQSTVRLTPEYVRSLHEAVKNEDYNTWAALLAERPNTEEFATQETFDKLVEADNLREQGAYAEARAIVKELGIGPQIVEHHQYVREQFRLAHEAVVSGDYATWSDIASQHPRAEKFVNQETFDGLTEAYQLRQDGKFKEAREVMKSLNLPFPKF
ncbi:hypothetical protein HY734_02910 [Candidatus Uhrbacteria bacterium]|nr:hypothetical protein [Candidatus Uhrbacteria bacterium]